MIPSNKTINDVENLNDMQQLPKAKTMIIEDVIDVQEAWFKWVIDIRVFCKNN